MPSANDWGIIAVTGHAAAVTGEAPSQALPSIPVPPNNFGLSGMADWLGTGQLPPHGFCLLWDPKLIALNWLGHGATALAYLFIPMMLLYIARRSRGMSIVPLWVWWEFSAFITCCAISHIMQIVTLYYDWYWMEAIWVNVTAFVSLTTAVTMPFVAIIAVRQAAKLAILKVLQDPTGALNEET